MAASDQDKTTKLWMKRIKAAEKAREEWENRYQVAMCRDYWAGFQDDEMKLTVNRIMPTIRAKLPGLFFYHPFARIEASPAKTDTPAQTIEDSTKLLQDTANTIIRDKKTGLMDNVLLSLLESFWAFGCIEVGYSADFADNPALKENAPPLKEEENTEGVEGAASKSAVPGVLDVSGGGMGAPVEGSGAPEPASEAPQLEQIVTDECFWVRRIPPRQFLCSATESTIVEENDWIGYWEYMNVEDVKKAPAYSNTKDLKGSSRDEDKDKDPDTSQNEVKIYKIWDQRTKKRYVFAEGGTKALLKEEYKRRKLFFYRPQSEPDRFRPIPPIFGWLSSQDEYNASRQFIEKQRKTRVPRFTVQKNGIDPLELEKFEDNEPNVWVMRMDNATPDVVAPIAQPNMSDSALQSLTLSRQEFDEVTGVGAEARQQATSDTATQAAIMNQRQNINDSFDRSLVAAWLAEIIQELVELAIDKMSLPKWIQMNTDVNSPAAQQDAMAIAQQWKQITSQQLMDAYDAVRWQVTIDVESLSPVSAQEKQQQWNQTLALISNPAVAPLLALSPELLKITLDKNEVKNAREQEAIRQALAANAQMQMQMAMAKAGPAGAPMPPGGPGGPPAAPGPPQMIPGPGEGVPM